jgi:anthranilate phosphoribosyltransferase
VRPFAELLDALLARRDLTRDEARAALGAIVAGEWGPAQVAGFLVAMRAKGASAEEVAGLAEALRARALAVALDGVEGAIDTCGTGGDGAGTFNVSTAAALVAAGAGARVAKHGNRAVSSRCGSADVLEALGVRIELAPAHVARMVAEAGFGFLFAPAHHGALRQAAEVRRQLGVRTVLNLLGPLANPAGVRRQVLGVFEGGLCASVAGALGRMGSEAAVVVHGEDGLDEVTTAGETIVARLAGGEVREERWAPERDFGLPRARPEELRGGDPERNARTIGAVLAGERGAPRDIVLANAAAALLVAGIARDLREGVERARESIDAGRAAGVLALVRRLAAEDA